MAVDQHILEFVESFWPLNYSPEELSRSYVEKMSALRGRFPSDILESLDALIRVRDLKMNNYGTDGIEEYQEITNIVFANRMHESWYPLSIFFSRTALSMLLQELMSVDHPFSILDMGCGSGMVDIGLVLQIPNIRKVYAVDRSAEALDIFRENIDKKIPSQRDKFVLLNRDYTTPDFFDDFKKLETDGARYVLSIFPFRGKIDTLGLFPSFLVNDGVILACFGIRKYGDDSLSLEEFLDCVDCDASRNALYGYGLSFERLNFTSIPDDSVVELVRISPWR